ncbi:hypothetical protein [Paraprevotella clara]|jgi:hypothetical protein|uniref:hypothetical protein n=1 Tax=Paraprevotella clara TaxID=454154 RepID=UPI002493BB4E|nr:hypothetical protein [Paraprevotella clara]BDI76187.1 hypothetical protein PC1C4_29090 [Paraprevotella clara]
MKEEIEKLKLRVIRIEQAIRQIQRMQALGLVENGVEEKIDEYLDAILQARKEIKRLETENEEGA